MTIAFVGANAKQLGTGVTSQTYTRSIATTGNAMVVRISYGAASSNQPLATWPAGWIVHSLQVSTGGNQVAVGILPNATAGSNSVTVGFASGTYTVGAAEEWSGVDTTTSIVDLVLTATGLSTSLTPTGTPDTTAQADEVLLSVTGSDAALATGTISDTPPSGYTTIWSETDANTYATGSASYKILSAITTVSDTWTFNQSTFSNEVLLISLKASSGGSNALAGAVSAQPSVSGTLQASQALIASAATGPSVQAAGVARMAMSGAAAIYPFAGGQFRQINAATALASVSPAIEGSVHASQQATGSAVAQPGVQGEAQAIQRLSAGVSLQPAVSGSFTIKSSAVSLTGAITVRPGVSGAMTARQGFAGTILLQPEVSGVLTISQPGTVSLVGAIAVQPGMAAYLSARQSAAGSVTASTRAAGSFTGINALAGSAKAFPSVAGAWLGFLKLATGIPAPYAARGTAYAWQAFQGDVTLQPALSGAIHPPFVGYPADPNFYILQAPRVFYVATHSRMFEVAMPSRSFYVLDDPTMPAQTYPGILDPAETKVLTIDGTASVPSGVTLVSIVGAPIITVLQGSDPNVASVFSGAAINTQPIAAQPPDIPTAIGANLGVQIIATNPADGCRYEIRIPCQTSEANNVVTLKAIVNCSAS